MREILSSFALPLLIGRACNVDTRHAAARALLRFHSLGTIYLLCLWTLSRVRGLWPKLRHCCCLALLFEASVFIQPCRCDVYGVRLFHSASPILLCCLVRTSFSFPFCLIVFNVTWDPRGSVSLSNNKKEQRTKIQAAWASPEVPRVVLRRALLPRPEFSVLFFCFKPPPPLQR